MSLLLCPKCRLDGYCQRLYTPIVSDKTLANPEYIRDLKNFAFGLGVKASDWPDYVADLYRDYDGWIKGPGGTEIYLNSDEFEIPHAREWFRDFCCTACPDNIMPRLRREARERVRALATILSARFPTEAMLWGRRPANDNRAPRAN